MIPEDIHDAWREYMLARMRHKPDAIRRERALAAFRAACSKHHVDPERAVVAPAVGTVGKSSRDELEAECSKPLLRRLADRAS